MISRWLGGPPLDSAGFTYAAVSILRTEPPVLAPPMEGSDVFLGGEADARFYLRQRYDATFAGVTAPFAIVHTATQDLLGSISLMRFDWRHARGEVGYWLAAAARGQGHATRSVRLICGWGFDALGLERIELLAATGNPASQRVAERAGFTREAVLRSYMEGTYERQDMVAFGLLRGELVG